MTDAINKNAIRLMARANRAYPNNKTANNIALSYLRENWKALTLDTRLSAEHGGFFQALRSVVPTSPDYFRLRQKV